MRWATCSEPNVRTLEELLALRWSLHPDNPLIRAPFPSPIIADPTFCAPDASPDGRWHLFAHSLLGIHHFTSADGVAAAFISMTVPINLLEHNRTAWNRESAGGIVWSVPVDAATIAAARNDQWEVILTPRQPVPRDWFGDLRDKHVLCLASGGLPDAIA